MGLRVQAWICGLILAGVGTYAYYALTGPSGFAALRQQRKTIEQLRQDNEELRAEIERRRKRNEDLRKNRDTLDLYLRQEYNLMRPGEKKFKYPDSVAPPASPVDPAGRH